MGVRFRNDRGTVVNVDDATAADLGPEWQPYVEDEQVVVDEAGTDLEPTDVVGEPVTDEEAASLPPAQTEPESPVSDDGIPVVGEPAEKPTRQRRK